MSDITLEHWQLPKLVTPSAAFNIRAKYWVGESPLTTMADFDSIATLLYQWSTSRFACLFVSIKLLGLLTLLAFARLHQNSKARSTLLCWVSL